jgi:uncharacterized protein with FMN-binding domain
MKKLYPWLVVVCLIFLTAAAPRRTEKGPYQDGTYEGEHSFVRVRVTVEAGKLSEITILEHGGGGEKYEKMVQPLVEQILENQCADVDVITGATVSSENLKKAVQKALDADKESID